MPPASTGSPEWRRTIATTLRRVIPGLGTPRRPRGRCRACPSCSLISPVPVGADDRRDAEWTTALRAVSTGLSGAGGGGIPGIGHARLRPGEMLTIGRCQRLFCSWLVCHRMARFGREFSRVTAFRYWLARSIWGWSSTTVSGSNDDESHPASEAGKGPCRLETASSRCFLSDVITALTGNETYFPKRWEADEARRAESGGWTKNNC